MTSPITDTQRRNAETILRTTREIGLGRNAGVIGITVALAEASLLNYANDGTSTLVGKFEHRQLNDAERAEARRSMDFPHDAVGRDLDSIGLFQQRPMTGWGPAEDLIDPVKATQRFYLGINGNKGLTDYPGWEDKQPWNAAQNVQGSPSTDGGIYREMYDLARQIVDDLHSIFDEPDSTPILNLEDIMAANAVIYHAGFQGTMYEVNLLSGTYWAIQTAEQFDERKFVLRQAGIPFADWPGQVNDLAGFGRREG
jgi:hypothetical protein